MIRAENVDFYDEKLVYRVHEKEYSETINLTLFHLSVSHSVMIGGKEQSELSASSPDELAFLAFTGGLG